MIIYLYIYYLYINIDIYIACKKITTYKCCKTSNKTNRLLQQRHETSVTQ